MILADGIYSFIVSYTLVQYCYVSNERFIFWLTLKYMNRNISLRKRKFDDCKMVGSSFLKQ